jgi:hypothetical protein
VKSGPIRTSKHTERGASRIIRLIKSKRTVFVYSEHVACMVHMRYTCKFLEDNTRRYVHLKKWCVRLMWGSTEAERGPVAVYNKHY